MLERESGGIGCWRGTDKGNQMSTLDNTPPPAHPDHQHERPMEPIVEQEVNRFLHEFSRLKILVALSGNPS